MFIILRSCPDSRSNDSFNSFSFCSLSRCIFMKGLSPITMSEVRLIWKRYLPLTAPTMSELLRLRVSENDRVRVSSCTLVGGADRPLLLSARMIIIHHNNINANNQCTGHMW